jgi:hypothetical protein
MKRGGLFINSLMLTTALLAGCAANVPGPARSTSDPVPEAASQREASDLMFKYRQQAAELRALAGRYELEAQSFARVKGEGDEQTKRNLENAKALWAAADEADRLAREYQRAVPHGQIY